MGSPGSSVLAGDVLAFAVAPLAMVLAAGAAASD